LSDLAEQVPPEAQPALLRAQEKSGKGAERALEVILRLEKNKEVRERLKEKRIEGAEERARGKLKALENRLNALEKLVKNLEEQGRDVSQAKANISKIKNKLAEVENLIEQKKYLEAFSTSHEIMRLLMETNLLVRPLRQQERESKILPMLPGQPAPLQEAAPEKTEPTETEITPSPESLPINVLPVPEP
jgi:DNA repair exonuclease SbcCD ATPase subunit